MARVRQTITVRGRRRRTGSGTGYHTCPHCHGTGRVRNVGRGAKK